MRRKRVWKENKTDPIRGMSHHCPASPVVFKRILLEGKFCYKLARKEPEINFWWHPNSQPNIIFSANSDNLFRLDIKLLNETDHFLQIILSKWRACCRTVFWEYGLSTDLFPSVQLKKNMQKPLKGRGNLTTYSPKTVLGWCRGLNFDKW